MVTITLTDEQARMVAKAMNNMGIKFLVKAYETMDELKRLGRTDTQLVDMDMRLHNECRKVADLVNDSLVEEE